MSEHTTDGTADATPTSGEGRATAALDASGIAYRLARHGRVGSLAEAAAARGVTPGQSILIHLDNCIEAMLAWFACVELGAIAVTTNTRSAAAEIEYFAGHCGAVAAITQPAYADLVAANCRSLRWMAVISHDAGAPPAQGHMPARAERFDALFADSSDRPRRAADPFAPCSVQYTSGTTSRPKAVLWTHANALWGAKINAAHQDLHAGDVHQTYLPLFHTNALAYSMLAALWVGGSCVIQPRFSASRFWSVAKEHGSTFTSTIPFCMKALLEHDIPKDHKFRLWGTAVCEPPAFAAFGIKIIGWWGMTETITHGIVGEVDQPNIPMSIGRAAPEYQIRITDDDGRPTEVGGTGNLFASLLGAAFYVLMSDWLSTLWPRWLLLLGLALIAVSLFLHQGLWGLGEKLAGLARGRRGDAREHRA